MKPFKQFVQEITEAKSKKKKPDLLDIDKDGDTEESMEDAADDKEKNKEDDKEKNKEDDKDDDKKDK